MISRNSTINYLVDYGNEHVFAAITNTWIVQLEKKAPNPNHQFELLLGIEGRKAQISQESLDDDYWSFEAEDIEVLKNKIKSIGSNILEEKFQIFHGIITGLNEAFVINSEKKEVISELDIKNNEILKPLIRGRDIGKYEIKDLPTWIIATKNEFRVSERYPKLAKYFEELNIQLEGRIESRGAKGSHWMNLRDCAYYDQMEIDKIVWLELTDQSKFAFSTAGEYVLDGAWLMTGPFLKELLGILNSRLIQFYFKLSSNSSGMGTTQWKKFAVENIPVPAFSTVPKTILQTLAALVDDRLLLKNMENK
jgi:hypothetical protein